MVSRTLSDTQFKDVQMMRSLLEKVVELSLGHILNLRFLSLQESLARSSANQSARTIVAI